MGAAAKRPVLRATATYTFTADGLTLRFDVKRPEGLPSLPRFGVEFAMPEGCERLRYFGLGDTESYQDKRLAARLGLFETTVTKHFEHYIRPQENMAHADTKWMDVSTLNGHGLLALRCGSDFSFNCAHFDAQQLTRTAHDYELVARKDTVVNLDYRHNGIGSNSCGPELRVEDRFDEQEFTFSVTLRPSFVNNTNPFSLL
jgi:beta-galactosidase